MNYLYNQVTPTLGIVTVMMKTPNYKARFAASFGLPGVTEDPKWGGLPVLTSYEKELHLIGCDLDVFEDLTSDCCRFLIKTALQALGLSDEFIASCEVGEENVFPTVVSEREAESEIRSEQTEN